MDLRDDDPQLGGHFRGGLAVEHDTLEGAPVVRLGAPAFHAVEDRGVKTAPFVVLVGTAMPAILAEVSCLSNDEEAALLDKAGYRQSIADALFAGIQAYLGEGAAEGAKETGNDSE